MGMVFSSDRSRACHPALTWPKMRGSGTRTESKRTSATAAREPSRCSSQGHCIQPGGGSGAADTAVLTVLMVLHKEHGQRAESLAGRGVIGGLGGYPLRREHPLI